MISSITNENRYDHWVFMGKPPEFYVNVYSWGLGFHYTRGAPLYRLKVRMK